MQPTSVKDAADRGDAAAQFLIIKGYDDCKKHNIAAQFTYVKDWMPQGMLVGEQRVGAFSTQSLTTLKQFGMKGGRRANAKVNAPNYEWEYRCGFTNQSNAKRCTRSGLRFGWFEDDVCSFTGSPPPSISSIRSVAYWQQIAKHINASRGSTGAVQDGETGPSTFATSSQTCWSLAT